MEKHAYLLAEQEKYKTASLLEPKDSYILYSWAINLRFQLENLEGEEAVNVYRESSKRYRTALQYGYIEKYVLWGLGSLKLHMAKKQICTGSIGTATMYLDKAEEIRQTEDTMGRRRHPDGLFTVFQPFVYIFVQSQSP